MTPQLSTFKKLRQFITDYCHFADESIVIPLSLWIAGTYLYEVFDSFPYLVITAHVKRAGKTRLSELIGFTCQMPFRVAGASAPSMFRIIKDNKPTILWDEAETLSSEAGTLVRAFLNVGYRKGQTIPRATGEGVIEWPTYCPKVFVLIGDVYDTLRDRSLVIQMERAKSTNNFAKRFNYETTKAEGFDIAEELKALCAANLPEIMSIYESIQLPFLTDRDEEIWRPIFTIAKVLDPESFAILSRIAVDMATEKTAPVTKWNQTDIDREARAETEEYAAKLIADMLKIIGKNKALSSGEFIKKLRDIDTAPWRKYKGEGLDAGGNMLATLLVTFDCKPRVHRINTSATKGSSGGTIRGYSKVDLENAAKKAGIK